MNKCRNFISVIVASLIFNCSANLVFADGGHAKLTGVFYCELVRSTTMRAKRLFDVPNEDVEKRFKMKVTSEKVEFSRSPISPLTAGEFWLFSPESGFWIAHDEYGNSLLFHDGILAYAMAAVGSTDEGPWINGSFSFCEKFE